MGMEETGLKWSLYDRYSAAYGQPVEGKEALLGHFHISEEGESETPSASSTDENVLWLFFRGEALLAGKSDGDAHSGLGGVEVPVGGTPAVWSEGVTSLHFMGYFGGKPLCAVQVEESAGLTPQAQKAGFDWEGLRALLPLLDSDAGMMAGRALQVLQWYRNNRFCGRCGTKMAAMTEERAMNCPSCGFRQYPRLSPAIIVAVKKEDALLLAHANHFAGDMFSLVAGFVEPGETFEDCVSREVKEEINIDVKNIRYLSSQPWPFPDSLMVGFTAEWASGEIKVDGVEIGEAHWYRREAMPNYPGPHTIAGKIIRQWMAGSL